MPVQTMVLFPLSIKPAVTRLQTFSKGYRKPLKQPFLGQICPQITRNMPKINGIALIRRESKIFISEWELENFRFHLSKGVL